MELTIDDWEEAASDLSPMVGPPVGILFAVGVVLLIAGGLTVVDSTSTRLTAYLLSGIVAASLIGLYRYVDEMRRSHAFYRLVPNARLASTVLLVVAWTFSCVVAWLLATAWSR
jgi:hypothetical protein